MRNLPLPVRIIETTYHGPTNFRGSRVTAKVVSTGKRVTVAWDSELDPTLNHYRAALEMCALMDMVEPSQVPDACAMTGVDGGGYLFVFDRIAEVGQ